MKRFFFLLVALTVAVMSWEHQLDAAQAIKRGPIPEQSIRLRIIANSDSFQDQWLKRQVRDAIVAQMDQWVKGIRSYEEARHEVARRLPQLKALVDKTIRERGFSYAAQVDFGRVPFPTKLYGAYVYPAGDYEALRVRIGEAKGQNWWCVLFPPLCFIDMANGDAVAANPASESGAAADASARTADTSARTADTSARTADSHVPAASAEPESVHRLIEEEESIHTPADEMPADGWDHLHAPAAKDEQDELAHAAGEEPERRVEPPALSIRFYLWDKLASLF